MKLKATIASIVILSQTLAAQPLNKYSFDAANSGYDELNPVISPDGRTLYVTIANHPENLGGKRDPGDIWVSVLTEANQWSLPIHGGKILNDRGYNGVAGFSQSGNMFLLSHYDVNGGTARTQGISVSKNTSGGWSKPENISIPYFQNKSGALYGFVPTDESFFIFSAETYGSYGVEDLYVSLKKADGKWSEPKNLGAKINTQFQELSPSISADGKTVYFSSNGRKGSGSFDIYASTRLDESWTNWSEPQNVGTQINSEGRELFYRVYPQANMSIYTSTKNSDGYGDIKMYKPDEPFPVDSVNVITSKPEVLSAQITEVPIENENNKTVDVHGNVVNAKTGETIKAKITFEPSTQTDQSTASPIVVNALNGYQVGIPSTDTYTIKIEAEGFISTMEKLDIKTYALHDLEMNFKLQPIAIGTTVNLKDILFEQSKTNLLPQSFGELNLVVSFLKANPKVRIELAGHTDNRGIPAQNTKLSQARVDKVKSYLISQGIEPKRINGKGYGGAKPIASNDTEETRKLNRRVEFTIKKF